MILKRGCNVDAGNLPETLIMKRGGLQTSCNDKQSVEERVLVGSHCKHLQHQHNGICGEHQDRNSVDIHEQEFQQHGIITTVANNVLCNKDNFNTQTSSPGCNSDTCQVLSFTFQPRPSKESTRNCTTLDRSLKDHIVNTVARKLLGLPLASDKLASTSHTASEMDKQAATSAAGASKWQKGGELELSEVAELFEKSILLQLKNECGGLQTLLRNHYHLFKGQRVSHDTVILASRYFANKRTSYPSGRQNNFAE
ncbi:tRNA methyltransferase 44 [Desmophyllum pertusum]|uniref:tRNA methyltransferase 44 n=1 Tax=Desmophyllum pertusum TaxID=174260 RepID=A0A9X0D182_9CNID|nr:tRNA methyltransferase 44 [Desmophyllum pertusum]